MRIFHILRHLLRKKSCFSRQEQLPQGPFSAYDLPDLKQSWACTGDFMSIAKNHCAAVCVTNFLLYRSKLPKTELFPLVHKQLGNGPVFSLRKAQNLISYEKIRNYERLCTALSDGRPCALMLANRLCEWHWVLVLGWREYANGERWLRISDGWNPSADRFYRLQSDSDWLSCRALSKK